MLHILSQTAPPQVIEVLEHRFHTPDKQREPGKQIQLLVYIDINNFAEKRGLALNHDINSCSDQQRGCKVEEFIQDGK